MRLFASVPAVSSVPGAAAGTPSCSSFAASTFCASFAAPSCSSFAVSPFRRFSFCHAFIISAAAIICPRSGFSLRKPGLQGFMPVMMSSCAPVSPARRMTRGRSCALPRCMNQRRRNPAKSKARSVSAFAAQPVSPSMSIRKLSAPAAIICSSASRDTGSASDTSARMLFSLHTPRRRSNSS